MSDFIQNITPDQVRKLHQNPVFIIIQALGKEEGSDFVDQPLLEKSLQWTRTFKPSEPQFRDPVSIELDFKHLGLLGTDNTVNYDLISITRSFIEARSNHKPDFPVLWRHLQTHLGHIRPETAKPNYQPYIDMLAAMIDDDASQLQICQAIVDQEKQGFDIPTFPLFRAYRTQFALQIFPDIPQDDFERDLERTDINWFPADGAMTAIRKLLKNQNYGLGEDELKAWLEDKGQPSTSRQLQAFFGNRSKTKTLTDLGILDEKGQWSEVGFQRFQKVTNQANESSQPRSLEWLRYELWRQYRNDTPVPFEWLLLDDKLADLEVHKAKRLASIGLSGGPIGEQVEVGDTINAEQFDILRKLSGWLYGQPTIKETPGLRWLGEMAKIADREFNWNAWSQVCAFVHDKNNQPPRPELIKDWQNGLVTFEGQGRYQTTKSKKIGRNDPCPCSSGKKYKKCCGR